MTIAGTEPPACVDCKHHQLVRGGRYLPDEHLCYARYGRDVVTGAPVYAKCRTMRSGECGYEGRLFEPR